MLSAKVMRQHIAPSVRCGLAERSHFMPELLYQRFVIRLDGLAAMQRKYAHGLSERSEAGGAFSGVGHAGGEWVVRCPRRRKVRSCQRERFGSRELPRARGVA